MLAVAFIICLLACERYERDQGGRAKLPGSPTYSSTAQEHITALARVSNVEEVQPKLAGGPIDGAALYATTCAACHQATGQGVPGAFPPLDGSAYVQSNNVDRLASIMLYGLKGPISVKGTQYNNIMMPQGGVLKDEELAAVATYIRSTWSNKSGPVEVSVFANMRKKWGDRQQFTIEELGVEPGA